MKNEKEDLRDEAVISAVFAGDTEVIIDAFLSGVDLSRIRKGDDSLLHIACFSGDLKMCETLLKCGHNLGELSHEERTSAYGAVLGKHAAILSFLMVSGLDLSLERPLRAMTSLQSASLIGYEEGVAIILKYATKAYINQLDGSCKSALLFGVDSGNTRIVRMLLDSGSSVNGEKEWLTTPLAEACVHLDIEMVELLLSCGADSRIKNRFGLTPLDLIDELEIQEPAKTESVKAMLLQRG